MRRLALLLAPLAVVAAIAAVDVAFGPSEVVLGLVVISPLLASGILGAGATAGYAVLAFAVAALLGVYDQQYTAASGPAQAVRLAGVALGGALAVAVCTARLRREDRLRRLAAAVARSEAQAERAERMADLAEALQRSLLTDPATPDDLDIQVRYAPAAEEVKIGGDWYDVFAAPGGRTMLVIGDVAGHDRVAAAVMAQVRHTLRGISQVVEGSPARLLTALDGALRTLDPTVLATIVLAQITRADPGRVLLCWSNAGHPPPLLVTATGRTALLERPADPLIGVARDAERHDHEVLLAPGDTLVLYTDGLVEQRGRTVDDGMDRLAAAAAAAADRPLAALCDALIGQIPGPAGHDDAALLAIRLPR